MRDETADLTRSVTAVPNWQLVRLCVSLAFSRAIICKETVPDDAHKGARSLPTNRMDKTNYMNAEAFAELKKALEDALAFERGERRDLHVDRIRVPRAPRAVLPKDRQNI